MLDQIRQKADVDVLACDISKEEDVRKLLEQQSQPCVGIVHAAGVLKDGLAANLHQDQVQQVFDPKINGALYLHQNTLLQPLQVCILFSSISALYGNIGQTAYSAANSYLDALTADRRKATMRCQALLRPKKVSSYRFCPILSTYCWHD